MPGLGPRVGGAHVDVNLKFDDKSVGRVGKQIHRQLARLGDQLAQVGERNREVYRSIGRDAVTAWRALLGTIVAGAPLMGSAISAVAGAATMLAGALYSAVQSSYGFAPLLVAIGIAAGTAAIGMNGFVEAVKSGDLSGLTPSAAAAASAVRSLSGAWQRLRDTVQENMFKGLADDIERLGTTLFPVLTKGLGKMATALNGVVQSILDYVNSAAGLKQISRLLDNSADIFARFGKAIVPALDGLLKLLNALAPAGKRLADRIADVAKRFQEWASAPGFAKRIDDMMKRAEKTAGLLFKVLGNLGSAIANIFNAANPATNTFLQMLVDVTQRFKEWTASAEGKNSIAEWAMNSVDVMRQFGKTLEAVFKVIAELADPRVIISFLKTVEGAFNYLGKLPLDKMVDAFVKLAGALQPVSSLFLAIIIAGAAFNIMIGSLIGQLGGLFSVLGKIVKPLGGLFKPLASAGKHGKELTGLAAAFARIKGAVGAIAAPIAKFFSPLASAGKHGKELTGLAAAFGRIAGVVARFAKFIPFAGWAIWIGMVIAKSKKLQEKFGEVWDAIKGAGSEIGKAFKELGEALEPLAPVADGVGKALGKIFDVLDKILEIALMNVLNQWIEMFKGLGKAIAGIVKILAGFVNVLVGIFTLNPDKILKGFEQIGTGLLNIFLGLGQTLLAPVTAVFKTIGDYCGQGFIEGLKSIGSAILDFGKWIIDGIKSVLGIASPSTVFMEIGVWVVQGLIQGIQSMMGTLLSLFGTLVSSVIGVISRLPVQLFTLGQQAVTRLAGAVQAGIGRLTTIAASIFNGVVNWIARLPGRLLQLGQQAITRLATAVSAGIGRLRGIAANIASAVVNALSGLPGKLLSLGQQAISKMAGAVQAGVGRLRGIAANIASAIVGAVKSLPGQMLSIGKNIVGSLVSGLSSQLGKLKDLAGKIGGLIKGALPGSPVEHGPLTAWNRGSGATGGGRNVIDAITAGLKDTSPIRKAMGGIADAVASSMSPTVGAGALAGGGTVTNSRTLSVTINNPQAETGSDSLTRTTRNLAYLGLA